MQFWRSPKVLIPALAVGAAALPLLLKFVLTSAVGPTTVFVSWTILLPISFVISGFLLGRQKGWLHFLATVIVGSAISLVYFFTQSSQVMNYTREVPSQYLIAFICLFACSYIYFLRSSARR